MRGIDRPFKPIRLRMVFLFDARMADLSAAAAAAAAAVYVCIFIPYYVPAMEQISR